MGDVDAYLTEQPVDARAGLQHIADLVLEVAPDAAQGTSYGAPAFRHGGRPLLGFLVAKRHLNLFVFSPAVIERVADRLDGFRLTKGTVQFSPTTRCRTTSCATWFGTAGRAEEGGSPRGIGAKRRTSLSVLLVIDPDLLRLRDRGGGLRRASASTRRRYPSSTSPNTDVSHHWTA